MTEEILTAASDTLPIRECTFLDDKACDMHGIYHLVKDAYQCEALIPLNKRNTKNPKKLSAGNPICEAGLAMHKDGKTSDNDHTHKKFCCPLRQSKSDECPCSHRNWNNGKKNRGCTK